MIRIRRWPLCLSVENWEWSPYLADQMNLWVHELDQIRTHSQVDLIRNSMMLQIFTACPTITRWTLYTPAWINWIYNHARWTLYTPGYISCSYISWFVDKQKSIILNDNQDRIIYCIYRYNYLFNVKILNRVRIRQRIAIYLFIHPQSYLFLNK